MAFCKNCGKEIDNEAVVCPSCGVQQQSVQGQAQQQQAKPVEDKGGFLWGLLGCCIPLVGLILFLVWKDPKPKTAKAAGIGALIGVGLSLISYIISFTTGTFSI